MADKTFNLTAHVTISAEIQVKASSLEDAINKTKNFQVFHSSEANGIDDGQAWVVDGELDGMPQNIHETE